ncbi:MAG: hypothetical protein DHS20C14_08680 [Phycisphaeraceae bacterium]|nr:MAG: hypothetical protein DHS20C14_08680 [Phycisphaeraceae bacterium]
MSACRRMTSRAGFTLIEMMVSLAVSSVLLLAMGSVMVLAARAIPDQDNRGARALEAARALEMIADDVAYAEELRFDPRMKVVVADRTGDGTQEVVMYAVDADKILTASWRDPTDRAVPLVDNVASCDFKSENDGTVLTAVTVTLTLADMPAEPFERRIALVNRPAP